MDAGANFVAETSFGGTNFVSRDWQSKHDVAARRIGGNCSCGASFQIRRDDGSGRDGGTGGIGHEAGNAASYLRTRCLREDGGESNACNEKDPESHELITYDSGRYVKST